MSISVSPCNFAVAIFLQRAAGAFSLPPRHVPFSPKML
jgi:hypothetical protein